MSVAYRPLEDDLGSVRVNVDSAGGVLESRNYDPYGNGFNPTGTSQTDYGFTGEPTDSNGLLYLRARYYNPAAGVFTALDPFEGMRERAMSLNGYSWVEGNVPNAIDPTGMQSNCQNETVCDVLRRNGASIRQLLAAQCVGSDFGCSNAQQYMPLTAASSAPIDYSFATKIPPEAYVGCDIFGGTGCVSSNDVGASAAATRATMSGLADVAASVGNIRGSATLKHWLFGQGAAISNYDVEGMIYDLPAFRTNIADLLGSSVGDLVKTKPELATQLSGDCMSWSWHTGNNPNQWRRVGIGADILVARDNVFYPLTDNTLSSINQFLSPSSRQFDWFIAQGAFYYSLALGIVVNKRSGMGQVCYQVFMQDHYGWYNNPLTGNFDKTMAAFENLGVGTNFPISGKSLVRCVSFDSNAVNAPNQNSGYTYPFPEPFTSTSLQNQQSSTCTN